MSHTVTVYAREDRHPCEAALATVESVATTVDVDVTVEPVDVDADPAIRNAYGERVPSVLVDGRPAYEFRVDGVDLRARLE